MWPNPQFPADLVTFTEEILNGKLHFCAVQRSYLIQWIATFKIFYRILIICFFPQKTTFDIY